MPQDGAESTLAGRFNVKRLMVRQEEEHDIRTRRRWFLSCGGAGIDIEVDASDFVRDTTVRPAGMRTAILRSGPSPDALYWTAGE